jgi:uncharacterized OB-fold protein
MKAPESESADAAHPYREGLSQGELRYQHCRTCDHNWLPARPACPSCLGRDVEWLASSGRGRVISWIVYHRAYADHLVDRIPYDVTAVELEEGPRVLTNVIDSDAGKRLSVGLPVTLAIEEEAGVMLARFRIGERSDA